MGEYKYVAPVHVVYPETGIKNSMVATEYPVDLRVIYNPTQLQRGNARTQQTFRGLNHQQETQTSIQSTRFQHPCSPVTASCSLQTDIWKGNPSDSKSSYTPSSASEESNGNIGLHTITRSSVERHCQGQQVKGSLAALNCGHTRTRNLGHSGGTTSAPHQQQVSLSCLSHQPLTARVLPDGESQICAQIEDYIAKQLAYFRTILTLKKSNCEHCNKEWDEDPTLQSDCITPDVHRVAHLPTTPAADKDVESQTLNCAVIEQRTIAVGQVVEEDSPNGISANTDFMITSKGIGGCATSASEKHSTEYPEVLRTAAATCAKNEDEGPVVLTAVPGRTREEHAKKQTSSMHNRRSSQEHKSRRVNKKKLRVLETPGTCSGSSKDMTKRENCFAALKKVEAKGLDSVPCATEALKGLQNKSSSLLSENKTFELVPLNQVANAKEIKTFEDQLCQGVTSQKVMSHSKPNVSVDKLLINNVSIPTNQSTWQCIQTNVEGVVKDADAVHVETDLNMALSEYKVEKHTSLSESEGEEALKQSLYENITDDDLPQLSTEIPHTEHGELNLTARYEAPQYEDISENESPNTEIITVEMSSPTQVPEPKDKQSSVGNEGYGHVQGPAQMETEMISDEEMIPNEEDSPKTERLAIAQHGFIETDDGFEGPIYPKCDSERQTNHPVSCSLFSVLTDEDETDDEIDDDYLVIPISVSALKFEPENENRDRPEKCVSHSLPQSSVSPPSSTSPTPWPPKKQVPASAFPSLEVFETRESFLQAKALQFQKKKKVDLDWNKPDVKMDPHAPQNRIESEDSCDTDDSCDYPSTSEENFLLVSRLCKKRSAPDDTIIIDSDTEDETDNFENIAPGKQPHSLETKGTDSSLSPNHGVARLVVVKPSLPNKSLELLKERKVQGKSTDGALPAKTFTASSQKTDSCVKVKPGLNSNKKEQFEEIPKNDRHHAVNIQASITKPRMDSRQVNLPSQEGTSTTFSSSSPTSEQLSEARKSSASSQDLSPPSESSNSASPPTSKHSTSMPRQHLSSSKPQLSQAHSTSSTLSQSYSPTKDQSGSATMELSARERLNRACANNFIPLRRKKRLSLGMEEDLRRNDLSREPRPGPSQHDRAPRQRHSSQKPETPLMKKTKTDAVQWTRAINKDLQGERRSSVGEGYKWSEKPSKAAHFHKHGSSRERRKYRFSQ